MKFQRPEIFRPPSEWDSYFLPLTRGCSNSSCTFCGHYGKKLQIREVEEVKQEVDALALFRTSGFRLPTMPPIMYAIARDWKGKRIFFQDGDALVYPFPKLRQVLQYANEKLPFVERYGCYATPQDILRRSPDELKELRELKLGIFYTGVESGDDDILKHIGKGVDSRQIIEAGRKAKEAWIDFSATVILGLGGIEESDKHALATARILTEIDPAYAGALTLTFIPGTPLHEEGKRGEFHPITPFRSLEELKIMMENSSFGDC
ncbi:MAG: radical SAM protein, partial [Dehalococcoidia bacterium]|nr:radical SAM protein [Dehalococcoidia bacterium]